MCGRSFFVRSEVYEMASVRQNNTTMLSFANKVKVKCAMMSNKECIGRVLISLSLTVSP